MRRRDDPNLRARPEGKEVERKEKLKSQWSRIEALVGAENRLKLIARDLVNHHEDRNAAMVGSGLVEGSCKFVAKRFKGNGMRWKPQDNIRVLRVRVEKLNGNLHRYFQPQPFRSQPLPDYQSTWAAHFRNSHARLSFVFKVLMVFTRRLAEKHIRVTRAHEWAESVTLILLRLIAKRGNN